MPVSPEAAALSRATIATLDREACARLLEKTFPLEEAGVVSGKLWARGCSTHVNGDALALGVEILGWQWVGQGSFGFSVEEYVYFRASVRASVRAAIDAVGHEAKLHVWTEQDPDVTVHEIGRVSARAGTPATKLLGVVTGLVGEGPNKVATAALRGEVATMIRGHARTGFLLALGETTAPGLRSGTAAALLDESELVHPGGALISGSFPPGLPTQLKYRVSSGGAVLARAVCEEEAGAFVDAVAAGLPQPAAASPVGVLTLRGEGEAPIEAQPCRWVLVTGPQTDQAVTVHVLLEPVSEARAVASKRWVRATVIGYALDREQEGRLLGLELVHRGHATAIGRPLTVVQAAALDLVADPVEVADGEPLVVRIVGLAPHRRTWWSGVGYDAELVGEASVLPRPGVLHEDQRAAIMANEATIGSVEVAIDEVEVP
jgi:hypothetical protein